MQDLKYLAYPNEREVLLFDGFGYKILNVDIRNHKKGKYTLINL
jgi:hypothetical protein